MEGLRRVRHWNALKLAGAFCLALALIALSLRPAPTDAEIFGQRVYALTTSNKLIQFSSTAPDTVVAQQTITGLQNGETLLGIDFRPSNGNLFALGSSNRLYTISLFNGAATMVGTQTFTTTLDGAAFGMDFNPVINRIRVVSDAEQNLRVNPGLGAVIGVDTPLAYAPGDPNAGADPTVVGAAHTNNISDTASTTLYVIDSGLDVLALQGNPGSSPSTTLGQLHTVGALGIDVSEMLGFDITPLGTAYVAYSVDGEDSTLGTIDLATGQITPVGTIGGGEAIQDIAIPTRPVTGQRIFAVTTANQLIQFSGTNPGTITDQRPISNLQSGEFIREIDFRPATGQLYGLSSAGRLYTIDPHTGAAATVGSQLSLSGTAFGIDFNPAVDRLRLVSNTEENLRIDPGSGAATMDSLLAYSPGDPNNGVDPTSVGAAYTGNISGTASTTLYVIDSGLDVLVRQGGPAGVPSPNGGQLSTIGTLGTDISELQGFDITPLGTAFVAFRGPGGASSTLGTIDLASGRITPVGTIGAAIRSIAIPTGAPAAPGPEALYAVTTSNRLLLFNSASPSALIAQRLISGLATGEFFEAIDFRPASGQLYGLSNAGRIYTIDPQTGAATAVGSQALSPPLSGTSFGFDFNPAADRIRLVSNSGQNLRINPNSGAVAATDDPLAYAPSDANARNVPAIVGAAYTDNISNTTSTTLYVIDSTLNTLALQGTLGGQVSPNSGQLFTVGALGIDATLLTGFDIGQSGVAYVVTTFPSRQTSDLATVDLATGRVTLIGEIGGGSTVRGLAVPTTSPVLPDSTPTPVPPDSTPTPVPTPTHPPQEVRRFFVHLPIIRR